MMTVDLTPHLTPEELVDSLDRAISPARQAHVDSCPACRAERVRLDAVVRNVAAVEVPEPSPLFWDHLSGRIREIVAREPLPETRTAWLRPWWSRPGQPGIPGRGSAGWYRVLGLSTWTGAVAVCAICAGLAWIAWNVWHTTRPSAAPSAAVAGARRSGQTDAPSAGASASAAGAAARRVDASTLGDDARGGEQAETEWALMVRMADEVQWDEVESPSMYVRPATVDHALNELSSDERRMLLRLMQAELARPSS
jgi:hypothetical protein